MKHVKKKNKTKKQGIKQVKQSVPMRNTAKLKNKQKVKKHIISLVKGIGSKPEIVKLQKNIDVAPVKQGRKQKSRKKLFGSRRRKLRKKQIANIENVNENVTVSTEPKISEKKQKVTNRLEQKQTGKVHKLRVLIEKRIREEVNAETPRTNQEAEDSKTNDPTMDNDQVDKTIAINEPAEKIQKHKEPQSLRDKMMTHLKASRFRFINEGLYTSHSSESKKYFKDDPDAFKAYHEGYKQQVEQWPVNPLDVIISSIQKLPKDYIIADLGCGEGRLATAVPHKVHSFDLVSINEWVKESDVTHTPLLTNGVHVVVFCLSLMGTNLDDYIIEANRVLKKDGILKIAEVESRFEKTDDFIQVLNEYGFTNTWKDLSHNLFYFMDFKKVHDIGSNRHKLPAITLKPCLYKKR